MAWRCSEVAGDVGALLRVSECYLVVLALSVFLFTCVSERRREEATSNRFGLLKYLDCLNCFSSSNNCCDVNAVRGRLVFPSIACAEQPEDMARRCN